MTSLLGRQRNRYTLERLQRLYLDLLYSIDVSKEDLGRRGSADHEDWGEDGQEDENEQREFSLVQVKRVLNFWGRRPSSFRRRSSARKSEELATAFRLLAATRSPDKEGENGGAAVFRDDASVSALKAAKAIERRVARIIRDIGEVVANGDSSQGATTQFRRSTSRSSSLKCDPCFEYFCEKNILSLFVEIVKEKPYDSGKHHKAKIISPRHRVVWGALVKAQVMQAISLIVMMSGSRNPHVFYYILSRNFINDLLSSILPLHQWTDPALEKLMPAFVELLKTLALQLGGTPDLFPFFMVRNSFPLFHAALEIGTSSYAQTDSFVHITCLNLIVNTMKIDNADILSWIASAAPELRILSEHLCQLFLSRYHRIADLAVGPIVDGIRCNSIGIQLAALSDQIDVLNDVLSCGVPGLNVRLCETLLRRVISDILYNLVAPRERAFLSVGISDSDVIPQRESLAQVSLVFLSQLFHQIEYVPLVRMLAVALFHLKSTSLWKNYGKRAKQTDAEVDNHYILVPALDALAQGKLKTVDITENPYRQELVKSLRGDYGEWRFTAAAIVVESVLWSEAIDVETLAALEIVPTGVVPTKTRAEQDADDDKTEKKEENDNVACHSDEKLKERYIPTSIEQALATFIEQRPHSALSSVLKTSLECAGSLALALFFRSAMSITTNGSSCERFNSIFPEGTSMPPLYNALAAAKFSFCKRALESQKALGVSDIFLELVESSVCSRYKKMSATSRSGLKTAEDQAKFACHLSQIGCASLTHSPEVLVRDYRGVNPTDVEEARFNVQMAIHFRSLCKVVDRFCNKLRHQAESQYLESPRSIHSQTTRSDNLRLDFVDIADDFAITFGGLKDMPKIHTHLDLRGRMVFPCFSASARATETGAPTTVRTLSEDLVLRPASKLVLVLDPTDIFVVKPVAKTGVDRGTVVCTIPLQCIIAAASDGEWLHVAVRHQDIGRLIKNGNMVLQFENAGTCLIVRQYLDRCRNTLRRELMDRFRVLLEPDVVMQSDRQDQATISNSEDIHKLRDAEKTKAAETLSEPRHEMQATNTATPTECTPEHDSNSSPNEPAQSSSEKGTAIGEDSEYETASEQGGISEDSSIDEERTDQLDASVGEVASEADGATDSNLNEKEREEENTNPDGDTPKMETTMETISIDDDGNADNECLQESVESPVIKRV